MPILPGLLANGKLSAGVQGGGDVSTVGRNLLTLTNPSAVTFPRFNADNTVMARALSDYRNDIDLPVLGLWDFWYEDRFFASASGMFNIAAISSGTTGFAIGNAVLKGYNFNGLSLRSSTTPNGGVTVGSLAGNFFFGQVDLVFRFQFGWANLTGTTVRLGCHSTGTVADAAHGVYFEIVDGVCSAKSAANSTRTTHGTTVSLSVNTPYTFLIDVSTAPVARFRIWEALNTTAIYDVSISTNIPTSISHNSMPRCTATESSSAAVTIGGLFSMGAGTAVGYRRARL